MILYHVFRALPQNQNREWIKRCAYRRIGETQFLMAKARSLQNTFTIWYLCGDISSFMVYSLCVEAAVELVYTLSIIHSIELFIVFSRKVICHPKTFSVTNAINVNALFL